MPLNPQQMQMLQQLYEEGVRAGQIHTPGSAPASGAPGPQASLNTPNRYSQWAAATEIANIDLSRPVPRLPNGPTLGLTLNDRVLSFSNLVVNVGTTLTMGFETTTIAYAVTAGVFTTAALGTAVQASGTNLNNMFRVQFERTNAYRFQTAPVLGGSVLGTAQQPRWLTGPCWEFVNASVLAVTVTPLVADIQVDVCMWTLEVVGPGNAAGV